MKCFRLRALASDFSTIQHAAAEQLPRGLLESKGVDAFMTAGLRLIHDSAIVVSGARSSGGAQLILDRPILLYRTSTPAT